MSQTRPTKRGRAASSNPDDPNLMEPSTRGDIKTIELLLAAMQTSWKAQLDGIKKSSDGTKKEITKLRKHFDEGMDGCFEELKGVSSRVDTLDARVQNAEKRIGTLEISKAEQTAMIEVLQEENVRLNNDNVDAKCRLMSQNLLFFNVEELMRENPYGALRNFMRDWLKLENAESVLLDRVNRMGKRKAGKIRPLVAQFHYPQDRDNVRRHCRNLRGTNFSVTEHFPREIEDVRRTLYPIRRGFRQANYRTTMVRDRLFVDGELYDDTWNLPFDVEPRRSPMLTNRQGTINRTTNKDAPPSYGTTHQTDLDLGNTSMSNNVEKANLISTSEITEQSQRGKEQDMLGHNFDTGMMDVYATATPKLTRMRKRLTEESLEIVREAKAAPKVSTSEKIKSKITKMVKPNKKVLDRGLFDECTVLNSPLSLPESDPETVTRELDFDPTNSG